MVHSLWNIQTFNDPIQIKRFPESFMVFAMRPLADLAVAEPIVEPDNRELCNCLGSGSDRRLSLKRRLWLDGLSWLADELLTGFCGWLTRLCCIRWSGISGIEPEPDGWTGWEGKKWLGICDWLTWFQAAIELVPWWPIICCESWNWWAIFW